MCLKWNSEQARFGSNQFHATLILAKLFVSIIMFWRVFYILRRATRDGQNWSSKRAPTNSTYDKEKSAMLLKLINSNCIALVHFKLVISRTVLTRFEFVQYFIFNPFKLHCDFSLVPWRTLSIDYLFLTPISNCVWSELFERVRYISSYN